MRKFKSLLIVLAGMLLAGCHGTLRPYEGTYDQVLVYCALGYNNLSGNLAANFEDIQTDILPGLSSDKAIVAFCHNTEAGGGYTTPNPPVLVRIYRGRDGQPVADTLKTYDAGMVSASKESLRQVLEEVRTSFPAKHYGMVFSSHGTGWLPDNYNSDSERSSLRSSLPEPASSWPLTKGVGNQFSGSFRDPDIRWIELQDFAAAIPMKLDYLILDACLMGTVETAWELRNVCDRLVFSPTEILAAGMVYNTLSWDMFSGSQPDLETYCRDYYEYYDAQSGSYRSATVTLVECGKLDALADAFGAIVAAHRDKLSISLAGSVQHYYYRGSKLSFFFDLRDLADQLGATSAEMARLDAALAEAVSYHAETPTFFDLKLERCCGLSTYIPDASRPRLNAFYRTLSWNDRVRLVE